MFFTFFLLNCFKIRTLFRLCSPVQGVLFVLVGYGGILYAILAFLNAYFLQGLVTVELVPEILITEILEVGTVNQDVILQKDNCWSNCLVKSLAITTVIIVAGPVFFPLTSSAVVSAATWGACGVTKLVFTKAALPIATLGATYWNDPIFCNVVQEIVIPAGFNPLDVISYHLLKAAEWTFSLGWVTNEWMVYFKIGGYFMALQNVFIICKLTPLFLKLPTLQLLVLSLHKYFEVFWQLTRTVPYSYLDSVPTRGEAQMLDLSDILIRVINRLCQITDTERFEDITQEVSLLQVVLVPFQ